MAIGFRCKMGRSRHAFSVGQRQQGIPNGDSSELIVLLNEVVDMPHVLEFLWDEADISRLVLFYKLLDEFHGCVAGFRCE